jgi:hypothetical protein
MCMTSGGTDVSQEHWLQCIFQDGNTFAIFSPILLVMICRFVGLLHLGSFWCGKHHIARFRQSFRQGPPWQAIA